jgi:hypothetical protein
MLNKLKKDFIGVRMAVDCLFGRKVNLGLVILYYAIALPFGLLMYPFAKLWSVLYIRSIIRRLEKKA